MIIIIIIGVAILTIIASVFLFKNHMVNRDLLWNFKHCNVIVAGKKGSGKDLLFQGIINKRKDFYYSNIPYGGKNKVITLQDVSVKPNTYVNMVNNDVVKCPHQFKDGKDIYISDIGNFLPSYMDSKLYVLFPSMPLFYSLSRHLYNNNVHCNTQNIERGWKALREQADFYVQVKRTYKIFGLLITKYYSYTNYESAKKNLLTIALKGTTIPHEIIGAYGAGRVLLKPAPEGTGVIAGGPVRAVVEIAGIKDIRTKALRSNNPINVVRATLAGLCALRNVEDVAVIRGKTPQEILA